MKKFGIVFLLISCIFGFASTAQASAVYNHLSTNTTIYFKDKDNQLITSTVAAPSTMLPNWPDSHLAQGEHQIHAGKDDTVYWVYWLKDSKAIPVTLCFKNGEKHISKHQGLCIRGYFHSKHDFHVTCNRC